MRVGVTGARGYLGSALVAALERRGHEVVELVRRPAADSPRAQVPFDLRAGLPPGALGAARLDALVHLAYDFKPTRWDEIRAVNADGSAGLFEAFAAAGGTRGVYVSTVAAYDGCRSLYGRAKLLAEQAALDRGYWVVRPGLILGDEPGGIVGRIFGLVKRLPAVPIIGYGAKRLYPVPLADLVALLAKLVEAPPASRSDALVVAAEREPLSLDGVVRGLAKEHGLRVPFLVPVPWRLAWLGLKGMETVGLSIGLRSDSVVSLMHSDPAPPIRDWKALIGTGSGPTAPGF